MSILDENPGGGEVALSDSTRESGSLSGTDIRVWRGDPSTELSGELRGDTTFDFVTGVTGDVKAAILSDMETCEKGQTRRSDEAEVGAAGSRSGAGSGRLVCRAREPEKEKSGCRLETLW